MLNKHKILKAINEGVKAGFKFSSNQNINNSSSINFSDSKVNSIETLNVQKINNDFKTFIASKDFISAQNYIEQYGTSIIIEKYHFNDSTAKFRKLLNTLISSCGTSINLNWIDTSAITDMSHLFDHTYFDGNISEWNVSNVINMSYMFYAMDFNGDISKWNVSNVINMKGMFGFSIFNNDISKWNVSNVKDMTYMFYRSDFNKDISQWKTNNLIRMNNMFESSKFNQDISNWNVSNVKDMSWLFYKSQFNRDIYKWGITKNLTNVKYMFADSNFDRNISNWKIPAKCVITGIFDDCPIPDEYKPLFLD